MSLRYLPFCPLILAMCLAPAFGAAAGGEAPILSISFDKPEPGEGGGSKGTCYSIVDGKGRSGGKCLMYRKDREEPAAAKPAPKAKEGAVAAKPSSKGKKGAGEPKDNFHYDFTAPVQPKTAYVASVWFKTEGDVRPSLRVATKNYQTIAGGICGDSKDWQEVRVAFSSGANQEVRLQVFGGSKTEKRETEVGTSYCDDVTLRKATEEDARAMRQCHVTIDAKSVLHEISPLFFGVNTLFWIETDASVKDGKIAKYLKEMPCHLMRFPGGTAGENYHWKTGKLDDIKSFPNSEGPENLSCDKFMVLLRQVGAEPIFLVNLESGYIHHDLDAAAKEAADWVQYANKEKGYNVKYWEMGNETYLPGTRFPMTAREYAEAVVKFSRAMKAVDPSIKIGACGPTEFDKVAPTDLLSKEELDKERSLAWGQRTDAIKKVAATKPKDKGERWWATVAKIAGPDVDFAIVHRYYPAEFGPDANADKPIVALKEFLAEKLPGRQIPIALTEWNSGRSTGGSFTSALILAELIGDYVKAGVEMATLWPMRYTEKTTPNARVLLDYKTNDPRPSYSVMKLYSSNMGAGSKVVKTSATNKAVYTCASLAGDGKRLAVFLVNKATTKEAVEAEIGVEGFSGKTAQAISLTAPSLTSDTAALSETPVTAKDGVVSVSLPPDSLTVVMLE